jgi:hypothetical protein
LQAWFQLDALFRNAVKVALHKHNQSAKKSTSSQSDSKQAELTMAKALKERTALLKVQHLPGERGGGGGREREREEKRESG